MKKTNMTNISMNTNNKRNIRVRIIAVALSAVAALSAVGIFAGCSAGTAKVNAKAVASKTTEKHDITGGYTDTKSPVLTDKDKALFQKATESLTGVSYTPSPISARRSLRAPITCSCARPLPSPPTRKQPTRL